MDVNKSIRGLCAELSGLGGRGVNDTKVNQVLEANIAIDVSGAMSRAGFRYGEDTLFWYDGTKYVKLQDKVIHKILVGIIEDLGIGVVYQTKSVDTIFKRILRSPRMPEFIPSRSIISFHNKVLNLDDMKVHDHGPEWMTRTYMGFDYDPAAKCPRWRTFLTEVISDPASIMVLQEFLGLIFIDKDELSIEAALFLYGTGSNGKSVVDNVIKYILGDDNCSSFTMTQLCTDTNSDYNTAIANGKLLNFASDMGDKDFSGGKYKAITARDPIMVRPIGMAPFEARDMPLLMANINKIPATTDSTDGYWRRNKIIRFERKFSEKDSDKQLKPKLRAESSGIFNWIIEGRERILAQKGQFTHSELMTSFAKTARQESSSVLSFLDEMQYAGQLAPGQSGSEAVMHGKEIMKLYTEYCRIWGNSPKSRSNFKADLIQAGFKYEDRLRVNGTVSTGYRFFRIDFIDGDEIGQPAAKVVESEPSLFPKMYDDRGDVIELPF